VYLQNHSAVRVAGEEAGVPRLGGLEVGGDAHVSVADRNLHVSVVVLHQGSVQGGFQRTGQELGQRDFEHTFPSILCVLCFVCSVSVVRDAFQVFGK